MNIDEAKKITSNPANSVWVAANAGAGKTTVLVSRLVRLFLSGVEPSRVLCLTYTNAGAVEMKERIFRRAREWVNKDSLALQAELAELMEDDGAKFETRARGLFSRLADAPTPLKIYTIHAFCQSVLKRFPLEAGVPVNFKVIEGVEAAVLLDSAYQKMLAEMNPEVKKAFAYLTENLSETAFDDVKKAVINDRRKFVELRLNSHALLDLEKKIFAGISYIPDWIEDENSYVHNVMSHIPLSVLKAYIGAASGARMEARAVEFAAILAMPVEKQAENFELYKSALLTKEGVVSKQLCLKSTAESLVFDITAEAERIEKAALFVRLCAAYKTTRAVIIIASELIKNYATMKADKFAMDYDDLIESVEKLFAKPDISPWILYKLDGGISHILIDEAQDTSPAQWNIVSVLSEHFFDTGRTVADIKSVFSVGDRKQSIFGFQGADVLEFDKHRELFANRAKQGGFEFHDVPLLRSFRSCRHILNLVDKVMGTEHIPHRADDDGYVEIVPLTQPQSTDKEFFFKPPVEEVEATSPVADLSEIAAKKILGLIADGWAARDIMILVQKRTSARYLEQALQNFGVPTSGRDKVSLIDDIIVLDLISLLKFCCSPFDDLSLCEALKSPLFGFDDDKLFSICYGRTGTVFEQMSALSEHSILHDLVERAGRDSPFQFFDYVLNQLGGASKIYARFGSEAEDILAEFTALTLQYDRSVVGKSCTLFIEWFLNSEASVKREMPKETDAVRIMTVHGSKGLEAPIVFLFDANLKDSALKDKLLWDGELPFYKCDEFDELKTLYKKRSEDEFYRLMYVALTRARDQLYVCGWAAKRGENEMSWYSKILDAARDWRKEEDGTLCIGAKKAPVLGALADFKAEVVVPEFFGESVESLAVPYKARVETEVLARGTRLHKLLENAAEIDGVGEDAELVKSLVAKPELRFIFENPSRTEAEFMTTDGEIRVDRLVFTPSAIWIIDYKSGLGGEVPDQYKRQLDRYARAVSCVYPGQVVKKAILWIETGKLAVV